MFCNIQQLGFCCIVDSFSLLVLGSTLPIKGGRILLDIMTPVCSTGCKLVLSKRALNENAGKQKIILWNNEVSPELLFMGCLRTLCWKKPMGTQLLSFQQFNEQVRNILKWLNSFVTYFCNASILLVFICILCAHVTNDTLMKSLGQNSLIWTTVLERGAQMRFD